MGSRPTCHGASCVIAYHTKERLIAPDKDDALASVDLLEREMPYVLVILRGGANADDEQLHAPAHERFISAPIK